MHGFMQLSQADPWRGDSEFNDATATSASTIRAWREAQLDGSTYASSWYGQIP
jgi:hypothetical protein